MSRIGVATPRDDCPYAKSNANTFVRARAYRVFLTSCVGINLGDIPRGLRHPWDVPSVDPSTLGLKTLYELASLKYCYKAKRQLRQPASEVFIQNPPRSDEWRRKSYRVRSISGKIDTVTKMFYLCWNCVKPPPEARRSCRRRVPRNFGQGA